VLLLDLLVFIEGLRRVDFRFFPGDHLLVLCVNEVLGVRPVWLSLLRDPVEDDLQLAVRQVLHLCLSNEISLNDA